MAISIPALLDTQLTALRNTLLPEYTAATLTNSSPVPPYVVVNRAADILTMLTGLIDSGTMTIQGIHVAADAVNLITAPVATNQATADTLADDLKAIYNAHRVVTPAVHAAADAANDVTAAGSDGTEPTLRTLVNDIRTQLIAHLAYVVADCHYVADPLTVTHAAATSLATDITLVNQLRSVYIAHGATINGVSAGALFDKAAFTTVNSLVGSTVTFTGNVTTALAGVEAVVRSNTVSQLNFLRLLDTSPQTGDTYTIAFTAIDSDLAVLNQGKGLGSSGSNPYAGGPSLINALMKLIALVGGSVPSYLTAAAAEPFGIGSPSGGAGSVGHGGAALISSGLLAARTAVAAYTKPA